MTVAYYLTQSKVRDILFNDFWIAPNDNDLYNAQFNLFTYSLFWSAKLQKTNAKKSE